MNKIGKTLFRLFLVTFLVVKPGEGTDFKWSRRSCVPPGNACNFTDNKNDQECPWYESCDFETDFCNWSNDLESETQWTRRNSLSGIGPLNDHKGNQSAYYLSVSPERNSKDFAVLRSVVFLPPKDICQMSFYYQFGHVNGMLKVGLYQQNSGHILEIWNQTSAQGSQWNRKVIKFNSKGKYQVIIQGIIFDYTPSSEGIAVDDITFSCGCLTRPGNCVLAERQPFNSSSNESSIKMNQGYKRCPKN